MNRRESIKNLLLGSVATGALLESCTSAAPEQLEKAIWNYQYGRTPAEEAVDTRLLKATFFTDAEKECIRVLANLILPPNEQGSIEEAGVVPFIEFMAKDFEDFQLQIRGGLMWLNAQANQSFGTNFASSAVADQKSILDRIAFEQPDAEEQPMEINFFKLMRNLVLTGYFTSAVGIKELGYQGNVPNVWDGVPQEVLDEMNLSYDPEWIAKCIDQEKRNDIAKWDVDGNLIS